MLVKKKKKKEKSEKDTSLIKWQKPLKTVLFLLFSEISANRQAEM